VKILQQGQKRTAALKVSGSRAAITSCLQWRPESLWLI